MIKENDFKNGRKAGKKHPNSREADLKRVQEQEELIIIKNNEELNDRRREIENEVKDIKSKLDLINHFLDDCKESYGLKE